VYLESYQTNWHPVNFGGKEPKVQGFFFGIPYPSQLLETIYEFSLISRSRLLKLITSLTPILYLTSGFKSLRIKSFARTLRKAGNSMIPFNIF